MSRSGANPTVWRKHPSSHNSLSSFICSSLEVAGDIGGNRNLLAPRSEGSFARNSITARCHDDNPGWRSSRGLDRCLVCASLSRSRGNVRELQGHLRIPTSSPMIAAALALRLLNFCIGRNHLNVTMVHHSGSIQSFKQQKGRCL